MRLALLSVCGALLAVAAGCSLLRSADPIEPNRSAESGVAANTSKFISAEGVAGSGPDESLMLKTAEEDARRKLADAIGDYCRSMLTEFLENNQGLADPSSGAVDTFVRTVASETSNAMLRQLMRGEERRDAGSGTLYVTYRVPISIVNGRIRDDAWLALRRVDPFAPSLAPRAMEELAQFLNAKLRERVIVGSETSQPQESAPREGAPPQWLVLGRHPDYPDDEFMSAVGIGDDSDAAHKSARDDLTNQVAARVSGFTADDLPGVTMVESWYDLVTDTHYTLGVLNRQKTTVAWQGRVEMALAAATELCESARNHHRADNYLSALQGYLDALARTQEALRLQLATEVVAPAAPAAPAQLADGARIAEISGKLRELLEEFSITKVRGDGQWTPPGVALAKQLAVLVTAKAGAKPIPDVPLLFRFTSGRGTLSGAAKTGAEGTAACKVERVSQSAQPVGSIECTIALKEINPAADVAAISAPSVVFNYVLRTRENTYFALCIDERDLADKPDMDQTVRQALATALTAGAFSFIEQERVESCVRQSQLQASAGEAEVVAAFEAVSQALQGEGFLLVIIGEARCQLVETTQTSRGELYFVHANVKLRVIDGSIPLDRTVLEVEAVGKGAYAGDLAEAARSARRQAAKLVTEKLISALNQKFGAG